MAFTCFKYVGMSVVVVVVAVVVLGQKRLFFVPL